MTPEDKAERVIEIARAYAYRRRHHISHTGHTVRRLLEAVSKLIERPVAISDVPAQRSREEPS